MKGTNFLYLNEATMIEALQMWIDDQMAVSAPRISSVVYENYDRQFKVVLESPAIEQ